MSWEPGKTLQQIELESVEAALTHHNGNKTHAARALGISIRTIRNLVKRYPELQSFRRGQKLSKAKKAKSLTA